MCGTAPSPACGVRECDASDQELMAQIWWGDEFWVLPGAGNETAPGFGGSAVWKGARALSASPFPVDSPLWTLWLPARRREKGNTKGKAAVGQREGIDEKTLPFTVAIPPDDSKTLQMSFIKFDFFFSS